MATDTTHTPQQLANLRRALAASGHPDAETLSWDECAALLNPPAPPPAPALSADEAAAAAAYGSLTQTLYHAGVILTPDQRDQARAAAAEIGRHAIRWPGGLPVVQTAAGMGVSAGRRFAEHWAAQADGRADAFGLDPEKRYLESAGRYDGAV